MMIPRIWQKLLPKRLTANRSLLIVGILNVIGGLAVAYYSWVIMHNLVGAIVAGAAFVIGCACLVAAFI